MHKRYKIDVKAKNVGCLLQKTMKKQTKRFLSEYGHAMALHFLGTIGCPFWSIQAISFCKGIANKFALQTTVQCFRATEHLSVCVFFMILSNDI